MSAKFKSFLTVLLLSTLPVWAQNHKSAKTPATANWIQILLSSECVMFAFTSN